MPTWNYAAVHVYGHLRVVDDPAWIRARLEELTAYHEAAMPEPWSISDAPHSFTEKLIGSVVGIEIIITRLFGKWKVSQNQPQQNQTSIIQGLNTNGQENTAAMANLIHATTQNPPKASGNS